MGEGGMAKWSLLIEYLIRPPPPPPMLCYIGRKTAHYRRRHPTADIEYLFAIFKQCTFPNCVSYYILSGVACRFRNFKFSQPFLKVFISVKLSFIGRVRTCTYNRKLFKYVFFVFPHIFPLKEVAKNPPCLVASQPCPPHAALPKSAQLRTNCSSFPG